MEQRYSYEKMGLFYLGRELDIIGNTGASMPLLLKSKTLTTHAAIIGMTGSGKTGLGIGLIEEAIMDNIPSIIIDPKGDMGNLLLSFPDLEAENFESWVDPAEAEKKGKSIEQYAQDTAAEWRKGLASWGQSGERISALRQKTSFTIYTPGSSAGISVSVLDSFAPPPEDVLRDGDTLNSLVNSAVSGLLSLIDLPVDSNKSPEYVMLSSLFLHYWRKGESLDVEKIIGNIVNPPFQKIGVFALDTYYPQKERMELAMLLNGVLASPAFSAWTKGEPLDIQKILYDENGKAKTAIFSIAHLSNSERMFFVTMLLNRFISWMRRQQGSSSLKAMVYMDEIFGYFPPTANPPSKEPMLLLLKQARAYGVGIILATQNPVDLDYKGLSNIGTWFIGRLQTSQDQKRVVDGIAGSSNGTLETTEVKKLLTGLKGRQFILRSAHLDDVLLFETRWVMSYLKGPISLPDIERLMKLNKSRAAVADDSAAITHMPSAAGVLDHPPLLPDTIKQLYYLHPLTSDAYTFEPWLAARGNVRFFNARRNIDEVKKVSVRLYLDNGYTGPDWQTCEENPYEEHELQQRPVTGSKYYSLPVNITGLKDMRRYAKAFADFLYQNKKLELFKVPSVKLESCPGETIADFNVRLADKLREMKEQEIAKIEERYGAKQQRIEDKIERAMYRVEKEKADVQARTTDTILSFGAAVLGAFFGRKKVSVSTISRASTGIKSAGRLAREKGEVKRAEDMVVGLQQDMDLLAAEIDEKITQIAEKYEIENYPVETFSIKPRRSDIFDVELYLLWEMIP